MSPEAFERRDNGIQIAVYRDRLSAYLKVVFSALEYTEADAGETYTYYIAETEGDEEGMTYDLPSPAAAGRNISKASSTRFCSADP